MPSFFGRGRPTKLAFSGLFLPSIEWEMKIEGLRLHEMEAAPGDVGTLFRHLRRRDVSVSRIAKLALSAVQQRPLESDKAKAFAETVGAVMQSGTRLSDQAADRITANLPGPWGCFLLGMRDDAEFPTVFMKKYVETEAASKEADASLALGDFATTAALVRSHPVLRFYWCEEDLDTLARAQNLSETLRPRLHAWLQLQLSIVAQGAVRNPESVQAQELCGNWMELLADDLVLPGKHWLRMAKELIGAKSLPKLHQQLLLNGTDPKTLPSNATIKRWSRGVIFPQRTEALQTFIDRVAARAHINRPSVEIDLAYFAVVQAYCAANRFHHAGLMAAHLGSGPAGKMRQSFGFWSEHHREAVHHAPHTTCSA